MVFGLSIGNKRRSSRVPDLSRYDYHYNGDGPSAGYYKSHDLSADAAFAASVNSGGRSRSMVNTSLRAGPGSGPGPVHGHGHRPGQGQGMAHHGTSFAPRKAAAGDSRVSSSRGGQRQRSGGPVPYGYGSNQGYGGSVQAARSYSLTSGRHVGGKQGKKQGKVGGSKASSRAGSLTNSIIIKTQEVKDMSGRTQSITTQTIRRVNGMEYVETTTQTTGALADDPQFHFQQFSENNGLSEEEEIGMESESEPEPHTEPDAEHEYISGSEPESKPEPEYEPEPEPESEPESKPESKPEPETEDGEFADASEIIEEEDHTQFFAKVNKVKVDAAGAPLASHTGNNSTNNNNSDNNNKNNNNNYNYNTNNNDNNNNNNNNNNNDDNHNTSVHDKKTHRKSAMSKRMTLRDSEVPDTTESPVNHTYQGKRRVQAPPVVAPSSSRKVLTQEEMYAMALEIAQQRYAESQQQQQQRSLQGNGNAVPVQVQGERPSQSIKSAGSHSGMEPILEDTAENPVEGTTAAGPNGVSGAPAGAHAGAPAASGHSVASGVPVPVPTNEKSRRPKKKVKSLLDRVVQFSQENTLSQPSGKHRRGHRGQVDAQTQAQAQPQPQPRPQPQAQSRPHALVQTPAQTPVQTQTEAPQTLATTQETSSSSSLRHAGPQQEEEPAPVPAPNAQAEAHGNHVTPVQAPAPAPAPAQAKSSPKKTSFFKKLFKTKDKHH
ncbi:Meiotic sister-chromatid recombination protein 3 [Kluyveromyces marxianus]